MSNKKKILYTVMPILIVVCIDWMSNWSGVEMAMLNIKKTKAIAEVIENPFYETVYTDQYGDINFDRLFDYVTESGNEHILYSYRYGSVTYVDSLLYQIYDEYDPEFGHPDYNKIEDYNEFLIELIQNPVGSQFKIYAYKKTNIPKTLYDQEEGRKGVFKLAFFENSFVSLLIIALFISMLLFKSYFLDKEK